MRREEKRRERERERGRESERDIQRSTESGNCELLMDCKIKQNNICEMWMN